MLDNLIHRLEIPGVIAVLHQPINRMHEYANDELHARFLTEELVPKLAKSFPLADEPRSRCLIGASFGAVAAFSTAVRFPGFYGSKRMMEPVVHGLGTRFTALSKSSQPEVLARQRF